MFEPALDGVQGAGQTAQAAAQELSPEQELEAWKAERMRTRLSRMPWRQIYLMAGLCFGIAGFVLPDSINDTASWLLYGLAAASFYASFLRRRQRVTAS
jgi:hypothetical protein